MLIIIAVVIAIAAAGFMACWVRRRGGAPTEPFPNLWPDFERQFRAYAARHACHDHTINPKE